jgi:hypothetical protein
MKLIDVLLLSLSLALTVVGIHQTLVHGIGSSYAIFMFAVGLLFWFQLRRTSGQESTPSPSPKTNKLKKKKY